MRDPILHLGFESDFTELCSIADQTQNVSVDLRLELRSATIAQSRAQKRPLTISQLNFLLGDFPDVS